MNWYVVNGVPMQADSINRLPSMDGVVVPIRAWWRFPLAWLSWFGTPLLRGAPDLLMALSLRALWASTIGGLAIFLFHPELGVFRVGF